MIEQVEQTSGKVVATFETVKEAAEHTNIEPSNIAAVTRGVRKTAGGYKWRKATQEISPSDTTYFQDVENGFLKVETYYDSPPHPDDVIKDHRIDTSKWKLSNFYSKGKAKGWLVTAQFLNIQGQQESLNEEALERVIRKHVRPIKNLEHKPQRSTNALRIIIADAHIGMDVSEGLYKQTWNKEELFRRGDEIIRSALNKAAIYGGFDEIHLIDLGDYLDGLDGQTVRRSHELPQNMSSEEAFDVALQFKLDLTHQLRNIPHNRFRVFNVCVDNHAGRFAYFVNSAYHRIIAAQNVSNIVVRNLRDFMEHYTYGKSVFVLSHGKDPKEMKHGMPAKLDDKTSKKIDEYLKHNGVYSKDKIITFEKGDSHQQIIDHATSLDFFYHSYMAFSPASAWVTLNYSKGRSGYNLMIVDRDTGEQDLMPKYF